MIWFVQALLLTTHSMDEAENVCSRIGIMVRLILLPNPDWVFPFSS